LVRYWPGRFDLLSLQSQDILNRQVFVLEILNITENSEQSLSRVRTLLTFLKKLWTESEHSENSEQSQNITENSEKVWTVWKFWTDSEQSLNITEHSEHCLNRVWKMSEKSEHSFSSLLFNIVISCDKLIVIKGLINTIRMGFCVFFVFFFFTWNLICAD